jgi:hypothetical protein
MSDHDHHRDQARVRRAAGHPTPDRSTGGGGPEAGPVVAVPESNVAAEPVRIDAEGIHHTAVRCRACNRRAFDVLGVPADVRSPTAPQFASLWIASRCACRRTSVGRVAARRDLPPPLGLTGGWRCTRGHYLAEVDPSSGRVRAPCRKCHIELYVIAADVMHAALTDDLARAS